MPEYRDGLNRVKSTQARATEAESATKIEQSLSQIEPPPNALSTNRSALALAESVSDPLTSERALVEELAREKRFQLPNQDYPLSDMGNAKLFAKLFQGLACHTGRRWYIRNSSLDEWRLDDTKSVLRLAMATIYWRKLEDISTDQNRQAALWASGSYTHLSGMLKLAASLLNAKLQRIRPSDLAQARATAWEQTPAPVDQDVQEFFEMCVERSPDAKTLSSKLAAALREWCSRTGKPIPTWRLWAYLGRIAGVKETRIGKEGSRGWRGIRLRRDIGLKALRVKAATDRRATTFP